MLLLGLRTNALKYALTNSLVGLLKLRPLEILKAVVVT